MLQLDLSIIIIVFAALGFFTMGYFIGRGERKVIIYGKDGQEVTFDEPLRVNSNDKIEVHMQSDYPSDGIRAINEPSGVILRPTAKELKKMNEDEITKQSKEEVAKAFEEEPVL